MEDIFWIYYLIIFPAIERNEALQRSQILKVALPFCIPIALIFFSLAFILWGYFRHKVNIDYYYTQVYQSSEKLKENLKIGILISFIIAISVLYIPAFLVGDFDIILFIAIIPGGLLLFLIIYLIKIILGRRRRNRLRNSSSRIGGDARTSS